MSAADGATSEDGVPESAGQAAGADPWTATWGPALLGVITSIATNLFQKPPWYVQLLLAIVLGVVYWRITRLRRRPAGIPRTGSARPVQPSRLVARRRSVASPGPVSSLWLLIVLAVVLNLLAVVLAGVAALTAAGVVVWVSLIAASSRWTGSSALQAMLSQVAAVSAGAAIVIGGQPVVEVAIEDRAPTELEGHWSGDFGDHYFRVDGKEVRGVYPDWDDGRIVGRIDDDVIRGWWAEVPSRRPDRDAGVVEFRIVRRGGKLSLDGRWANGAGELTGQWDLEKVDDVIPPEIERKFADASSFIRGP
jgi:hypothetical protein